VRRIIVPFFVTLLIASSPNAQAQQADYSGQAREAAMAAAAGPEFCRRGPCPGFDQIAEHLKSLQRTAVSKPAAQPKPALFPPNKYQSAMTQPKDDGDTYVPPPIPKTNVGKTPSSLNLSGDDSIRAPQPDPGAYSPQIEARGWRMFPSADQNEERERWMTEQEQRAIANDINRAKPLLYPVSGR
jgi:hypothetical protein